MSPLGWTEHISSPSIHTAAHLTCHFGSPLQEPQSLVLVPPGTRASDATDCETRQSHCSQPAGGHEGRRQRAREAGADNVADTVHGGHPTDMHREAPPTGHVGFPPAEPRPRADGSHRTPASAGPRSSPPQPRPPHRFSPPPSTPPAERRLFFLSWQPL